MLEDGDDVMYDDEEGVIREDDGDDDDFGFGDPSIYGLDTEDDDE